MTKHIVSEEIVFENPPAPKRRGRKSYVWADRLMVCVQNPGRSIRVKADYKDSNSASQDIYRLRKGKLSLPEAKGNWEFQSRTIFLDANGKTVDVSDTRAGALYATFHPSK